MQTLNQITVTEIRPAETITYEKAMSWQMTDRPYWGLSFAIEGKMLYRHNGKDFLSDGTHAILLPMGASYRLKCCRPGRFTLVNFRCGQSELEPEFQSIPIGNPLRFQQEHRTLERLNLAESPQNHAEFLSVFYHMLSRLSDSEDGKAGAGTARLAKRFMEENLQDPLLSVSQAAEAAGICEAYLRRLFHETYRCSPKQYIQRLRIQAAKELLIHEERCPVTAIAERCGYTSPYHFSRAFKLLTGYTPTEYRKQFLNVCL